MLHPGEDKLRTVGFDETPYVGIGTLGFLSTDSISSPHGWLTRGEENPGINRWPHVDGGDHRADDQTRQIPKNANLPDHA